MNNEKHNLFILYNCRYYVKNKKSSLFNILTIAIGIAVFLVIQVIILANNGEAENSAYAKVGGDIGILINGNQLSSKELEELNILSKDGCIEYTRAIWSQGVVSSGKRNSMCTLRYIDSKKYPYHKLNSDSLDYSILVEKNVIAISRKLAKSLDVKVGDKIKVQGIEDSQSKYYKIKAIVPDDGEESMDMNIYGYIVIDGGSFFDESDIECESLASKVYVNYKKDVKDKIKSIFKNHEIQLAVTEKNNIEKELENSSLTYNSMGMLSVIMAFIGIVSSMILTINKRRKEICILKLYGATSLKISVLFLGEIVLLSFIGIMTGILTGLVSVNFICSYIFEYSYNVFKIKGLFLLLVRVFVMGIVSSIIFGLVPVVLTQQMKPVTVLRERVIKKTDINKILVFTLMLTIILLFGSIFSVYVNSIKGFLIIILIIFLFLFLYLLSYTFLSLFTINIFNSNLMKKIAIKSLKKDKKRFSFIVLVISLCTTIIGMVLLTYNSIFPSLEKQVENSLGYNALFKTNIEKELQINKILKSSNADIYYMSSIVDFSLININGTNPVVNSSEDYSMDCMHGNMDYVNGNILEGEGLGQQSNMDNGIVFDEDFAYEYNINTGDKIVLSIDNKQYKFYVTGIRKSDKIKTGHAYIDYATVKKYIKPETIRYYVVTEDVEGFIDYMNTAMDDIIVLNIEDISSPYAATLNKQMELLKLISILCIGTSIFLIFNILSITYMGKFKEFLILGMYGAEKKIKRRIIIIQGIKIGLASSVMSFLVSFIGAFFMEMLTKLSINYDFITIIEVVMIAIFCSLVSILIISTDVVNFKQYELLRVE